jgi:hypothetical protein
MAHLSPVAPPLALARLRTDTPPSDTSVLVSLIEQSVAVMLAARPDEARRHRLAPDHRTSGFLIVQEHPLHQIYWEKCGAAEL